MKAKRIITGLVGFPIVVAFIILANRYVIDVVASIVALIAIREYFNSFSEKGKPIRWIGYLAALCIAFIHVIPEEYLYMCLGMSVPLILAILFIQAIVTNMKYSINDIAITLLGICYVVGFILFVPLILGLEGGKFLIWYVIFAAWGSDTFAYIVGVKFGKHKLTQVSPKKSIEGSIGGVVGALLFFLVYTFALNYYTELSISYWQISILAVLFSGLGQIGDLAASTIKRFTGIKDFGAIVPGHGGILDRIDSIIYIAPFAYFLFVLMILIDV